VTPVSPNLLVRRPMFMPWRSGIWYRLNWDVRNVLCPNLCYPLSIRWNTK